MTAWTLQLPWATPPLTENQRFGLWGAKATLVKNVRVVAIHAAYVQQIPYLGRCRVTLTWVVATRHRRDADNVTPTLKALSDGLVDASIVTDDIPDLVEMVVPVVRYEHAATPHMELLVEAIS